jgi:hypothetical protein
MYVAMEPLRYKREISRSFARLSICPPSLEISLTMAPDTATSTAFSETLQFITSVKLAELENQVRP